MSIPKVKVLVAGGAGYIGGHVVEELQERGYEVSIFDIKKPDWVASDIKFIEGNIEDFESINKAVQGMDIVYNFAGVADIIEAASSRLKTIKSNIIGCSNLLEACHQNKVKKFIFASTIYVYSEKGSFYRISKQACEALVEEYYNKFNLDFVILRYGSLYGGRAQSWNGLKKYVNQILTTGKITLKGNGTAKREYIHINDAKKMSVDSLDPRFSGKSLILSGTQVITHNELVHMIEEMIGKKVEIVYDHAAGDHYDITPYRYHPKIGIKFTTNEFIDFGQGILELIHEVDNEIKK